MTPDTDLLQDIPKGKPVRIFLPLLDRPDRVRAQCIYLRTEPPQFTLIFKPGVIPIDDLDIKQPCIISIDIGGRTTSLEATIRQIINPQTLQMFVQKSISHAQMREFFRVDAETSVISKSFHTELFSDKNKPWSTRGQTIDISGSGLLAIFDDKPRADRQVKLEVKVPSIETDTIKILAHQVRAQKLHDGRYEVAYHFDDISTEDRDKIICCCLVIQRKMLRMKVKVKEDWSLLQAYKQFPSWNERKDSLDTIKPVISIAPVSSSTSQGRERSQGQPTTSQGQELKALVIEARGDNRFILDIGGTRQPARSEANLAPGQLLRLQVVRTEPQIELQIVPSPQNLFQGRSLTLLGKNIDLTHLMQSLQQHNPPPLETLSPASRSVFEDFFSMQQNGVAGQNGGTILRQLIDSLGLNLEQLLARGAADNGVHTLKAALLELAQSFSTAGSIAEATTKLLATLEIFQIAQVQIAGSNQLLFPLPLPFIEQGYLLVEQDGKDKEQGDSASTEHRFSLHLTVSELGNLQVDFLHNMEGLFIRFRASDQQKADFIESFGDELKQAISAVPLISLSFSGDAPDPIHDLVRQLAPEGNSILDTKV